MARLGLPLKDLAPLALTSNPAAGQGLTLDQRATVPIPVQWFPACRVYSSDPQAITTGTVTALDFPKERFDNNEIHSEAANITRLTCKTPGIYDIGASIAWEVVAAGTYRQLSIRLNGATVIAPQTSLASGSSGQVKQTLNTPYALKTDDYVEAVVDHDRGSDLNILAAGNYSPEFWMVWVAPHPDASFGYRK